MLQRLLPFRHRIRIEPRRKSVIVRLDGKRIVFRSKLLVGNVDPIDVSRVALWKKYGPISRMRERALERLRGLAHKRPYRAFRLVKRLLSIWRSGSFRSKLKDLLMEIRYGLPRIPKKYYKRIFRQEIYELAGEYAKQVGLPRMPWRVRYEPEERIYEELEKRRYYAKILDEDLRAVFFSKGTELRVYDGRRYVVIER